MTDKELELADVQPSGVEMVGPFGGNYFHVTIDGIKVPYLTAYSRNPQQTVWTLLLDGRMSIDLPSETLPIVVGFIADALAVGAGYFSHSHACSHQGERHNPFGTRMIGLKSLPDGGVHE